MKPVLLSVNTARVSDLFVDDGGRTHRIATGIHKRPAEAPLMIGKLGLEGDEQADLTVHGGLDKAVYAYPVEHYPFWQAAQLAALKREQPLPYGSMGENLTIQGLLEQEVWVGDHLAIGSAVLQVTEPRSPCYKFAAKMGFKHAVKLMVQSGASGFYLRVIQEGVVAAGDAIALSAGPREVSIAQINDRRRKGRQRDLF